MSTPPSGWGTSLKSFRPHLSAATQVNDVMVRGLEPKQGALQVVGAEAAAHRIDPVGFTIVPPAAPSGAGDVVVEYLFQRSNLFTKK